MQPADHHPRDPTPNGALRRLLTETEWTQEAFARAIGRLGAESGVRLSYDRTSVAHWLRGTRPSPRVQGFIAEALSRRLGRPVSVTQLGMGNGRSGGPGPRTTSGRQALPEAAGGPYPAVVRARPADQLAALTAAVVGPPRADSPPAAPYRLMPLTPAGTGAHAQRALPARRLAGSVATEATETPEPHRPRPHRAPSTVPRGGRPGRRITAGEVASVREHVRFFSQQADRHGGGHIRTPLAAALAGLVCRLRTGGDGPHHAQLLAGTARLSYLLARVYADEQRHGLAQRAFLTAAELAAEGDDPEGVALARRALSSQAYQLGHRQQSLVLAEAACAAAPDGTAPSARAFLYAGLAVAQASADERGHALAALRRAEYELARVPADMTNGPESPTGEPVGAYQDASLLYQSSQVRAALGDRDGAIRELRSSLQHRPAGECRSRALSQAELAELLLSRGSLEEACQAWHGFLEDCAQVRSGRVRRARDRMPRLLRPYARERCVQALSTRAGLPPGTTVPE